MEHQGRRREPFIADLLVFGARSRHRFPASINVALLAVAAWLSRLLAHLSREHTALWALVV